MKPSTTFAFFAIINALAMFTANASTTLTWTGSAGDDLMNTANNWSPQAQPTTGDDLIFPSGLAAKITNNVPPPLTLGSAISVLDAYTIQSGTFQIPVGGTTLTYGTASSTINTAFTLDGALLINSSSAGNTLGGQITSTGAVTVLGTVIFSNGSGITPNNYTGTTSVGNSSGASGTLTAGASGAFSSASNVVLFPGSTLSLVNGGVGFNCSIGPLTQGSGTGNSMITLGNGLLTIVNSGTITYPGIISALNGGVALSGSGTLQLTGSNVSFSSQANPATVSVASGTILQTGSPNALGSVAAGAYVNLSITGELDLLGNNLVAGTLNGSGTLALGGAALTVTGGGTFSGTITGPTTASTLTVTGASLTLSGANTFSGPTTLGSGGTLDIDNANALMNSSALNFNSGLSTLELSVASFSFAHTVTLNSGATPTINLGSNNLTLGGTVTGSGILTVEGTGTLTLNGTNNYSGTTIVDGATLEAGTSTSAFGTSTIHITNDGTLNLNGNNNSIASLAGSFGTNVFLSTNSAGGTLTITDGSVNDAFYGVIANQGTQAGSLAITTGTVTLMEPNTYTGTTTLSGASTLNTFSLGTTNNLAFTGSGGTVAFASSFSSSATLTLSANAVLTPNTFDISLSGPIQGSAGVLFALGPGKLTLTGTMATSAVSSFHNQGSTVNVTNASLGTGLSSPPPIIFEVMGGVVQAGGNLSIPTTQTITLSGVPGTFDLNSHTISIASPISGGGNLIVTDSVGGGTLTLTNTGNNYTGSTSIYNGTLNAIPGTIPQLVTPPAQLIFGGLGAPASATPTFQCGATFSNFTPAIVMMSNAKIDTNGNSMTASGIVAGLSSNSLTKVGLGTLTLSGANIYQGPTNVNVGTLQAGVASTSTSGAFGVGSAVTVASGATLDLNSFNNTIGSLTGAGAVTLETAILTIANANSLTFSGNITGSSGGLALTTGTLTLSGNNAYSGTTSINGGTLTAGSTTALANNSEFVVASGATLNVNSFNNTIGSLSGPSGGAVTLGSANLTLSNGGGNTFAGSITGSGGLILTTGTQILSGSNSYQGSTTLNGGTLEAGAAEAFSNQSAVTVASGATLSLNGFNNAIKSLSGVSGSNVNLGSGVLTIANGNSQTFSGSITGTGGGLTLASGQFTLAGTNSYTGTTTVTAGELIASNGNTSPFGTGSNIAVLSAGTLNFGTVSSSNVSVGGLQNSGIVDANLTSGAIHATSYVQSSAAALSLVLPATPSGSFQGITTSGAITLSGSLTVTGLTTATAPIILMESTGSPNQLNGQFSSSTLPHGFALQYDYADNQVFLQGGTTSGCQGTWNFNSTANWGDVTNWNPNTCAPGVSNTPANLDTATFSTLGSSSISIFLATSGGSGPTPQNVTLYSIDLSSPTTSYNIFSYFGSTITLDGVVSPKPRITVSEGSQTIYAPVVLNKNSRYSLSGTLTMGLFSSVTSSVSTPTSTLFISENDIAGTLNNYGAIAPGNVNIEGCTVNNYSTISPSGTLQIQALSVNADVLTVNNFDSMFPSSLIINGSASPTVVNNQGAGEVLPFIGEIATTTGGISITDATVNNTSGGQIFAASGQTLTINSGTVTNDGSSIIGSTTSNLSLLGGTLISTGQLLAQTYTQANGATLQLNVQDASGNLRVESTANLGGILIVNSLQGRTPESHFITLVTSPNGFASEFSQVSLVNFSSALIAELVFTPTSIVLVTTPATIPHLNSAPGFLFSSISQHNSFITRKCFQLVHRMPKERKQQNVAIHSSPQGDVVYAQEEPLFRFADRVPYSSDGPSFEIALDSDLGCQLAAWSLLPQHNARLSAAAPVIEQKQAQLARRSAELQAQKPFNIYAGPIGAFGSSKASGTQVGAGFGSAGGLIGFDAVVGDATEGAVAGGIGAIVDYERIWVKAHRHTGTVTVDKTHGSLYATLLPVALPELYFEAIGGFTYTWDKLKRHTGFDGSLLAKSNTHEIIFDALAGVEFTFNNKIIGFFGDNFSITPLAHVQYAHDHVRGFQEKGAGNYDLKVKAQNIESLSTSIGARFDYFFSYPEFTLLMEVDAEWQREYLNHKRTVYFAPFNLTDIFTPSTINGAKRNTGLVALDLLATFSNNMQLEANGTFQWNHKTYNAFFYLGLGRVF